MLSAAIAELDLGKRAHLLHAVRDFNQFDEDNDPYHEHDCFLFDLLFEDPGEVDRFHQFRFIVSDRSAQYGVLHILYVERLSS